MPLRRTAVDVCLPCAKRAGEWATAIALIVTAGIRPFPCGAQTPWTTNGSNLSVTGYNVGIGTTTPGIQMLAGRTYLTIKGASNIGVVELASTMADGDVTRVGMLQFTDVNFSGTDKRLAVIAADTDGPTSGLRGGALVFFTKVDGNAGLGVGERMRITRDGNVGIGTAVPQYKLAVNGTIGTKEVIVTNTGWSDYVFKPNYRLRPLKEIASYIKANHHLPEIPSEAEVQEKGVSVGEMQAKLLAKVEELTLHMIQAEERNDRLEQENRKLQARLARLEGHIER
jgi:hypothetical protein